MINRELVTVRLQSGKEIQVFAEEIDMLRKRGRLMEEDPNTEETVTQDRETVLLKQNAVNGQSEKENDLPKREVLTKKQRMRRIKKAKKLRRQGYPFREIGKRLNISHTAVQKWEKSNWQLLATF